MSKKSINKKDIVSNVRLADDEGRSRQELWLELREQYYDEKKIARIIANIPKPELRKKYGYLNTTLITLLSISALGKMTIGIELLKELGGIAIVFFPLFAIIDALLIIGLRKFDGSIYNTIAIFGLVSISQVFRNLDSFDWAVGVISILFSAGVSILALITKIKIFPHLPFNGIVDKAPNGDYELGD